MLLHVAARRASVSESQVTKMVTGRNAGRENVSLSSILWAVVVILVVLWLVGLVAGFAGGLIHILLIIAIIVILYNLFVGRRTV